MRRAKATPLVLAWQQSEAARRERHVGRRVSACARRHAATRDAIDWSQTNLRKGKIQTEANVALCRHVSSCVPFQALSDENKSVKTVKTLGVWFPVCDALCAPKMRRRTPSGLPLSLSRPTWQEAGGGPLREALLCCRAGLLSPATKGEAGTGCEALSPAFTEKKKKSTS